MESSRLGNDTHSRGNRANGARDNLCVDASRFQPWQDLGQLAVAHERFTTNDRHVKGTVLVDEREESSQELIPAVVAELTKVDRIFRGGRSSTRSTPGTSADTLV